MKKLLVLLSLVVVALFLIGCAPKENVAGEATKIGGLKPVAKTSIVPPQKCPECAHSSKPIYLRLYERGSSADQGVANRILLDHPLGPGWNNSIGLNRIADTAQAGSVGFDLQKESGYEYLVLALNQNKDVDFGRIMVNIELTQVNQANGYVVVKLIRK